MEFAAWAGPGWPSNVDFAVAEASLAHVEHNAVVRAYSRTDYLEQRRKVLEAWDEYVNEQLS